MQVILMNAALHKYIATHNEIAYIDIITQWVPHERAQNQGAQIMATKKTDDVFSLASFDPAKVTETFRDFAEKGAAQSKEAYSKMKTAAEDATKTVEATIESAQSGSVELGLKAIDALRTNAENSLSHMEALLGVKSVSELFELQTAFIRKQAELAMEQAKSMQEATRKIAETVTKPGKDAAEKAISGFKKN
jgi:phasin